MCGDVARARRPIYDDPGTGGCSGRGPTFSPMSRNEFTQRRTQGAWSVLEGGGDLGAGVVRLGRGTSRALERLPSGMDAFDRLVGDARHRGMVHNGLYLIAGPPGIGKTTLTTQIAAGLAQRGEVALLAPAEKARDQVDNRAACASNAVRSPRRSQGRPSPGWWRFRRSLARSRRAACSSRWRPASTRSPAICPRSSTRRDTPWCLTITPRCGFVSPDRSRARGVSMWKECRNCQIARS